MDITNNRFFDAAVQAVRDVSEELGWYVPQMTTLAMGMEMPNSDWHVTHYRVPGPYYSISIYDLYKKLTARRDELLGLVTKEEEDA